MSRISSYITAVIIIIIASVAVASFLISLAPEPERRDPPPKIPFANTGLVTAGSGAIPVYGAGTVRPSAEIDIVPQVGGKIVWVDPGFQSGGRVEADQTLFRIEEADYLYRVQEAEANFAARRVALLEKQEPAAIARAEYERYSGRQGDTTSPSAASPLTLREPQLNAARAELNRVEVMLADARLALTRTRVTAPFDGFVSEEFIDVGQIVSAGQTVGRLFAADAVEGPLERGLRFALDQPAVVIAGAIGRLVVSVSLLPAGIINTTFVDVVKGDFVTVVLEMPDGTPVERTDDVAKQIEAAGQRVVTVTADVDPAVISGTEVTSILQNTVLAELAATIPGMSVMIGGETQQQFESLDSLNRSFILAIFVIFALLAIPLRSYTKPLIIMAVIPFGLIGAILGHLIMGIDFSFTSIMGFFGLSGVVVNDSLVMIDFIDQRLKEGTPVRTAIIDGAKGRFRPIFLTSVTTFLGFTPLILERSIHAAFLVPFAASLGFGILITTIILMMVVPALTSIHLRTTTKPGPDTLDRSMPVQTAG